MMYRKFRDQANFFVIYIAEAHPTDGWQTESNVAEKILIAQARSLDERMTAASECAEGLALRIPILVDSMDDAARISFSAWPERIYIIGPNGRIHYRGGQGPYDFDPTQASQSLQELLGSR